MSNVHLYSGRNIDWSGLISESGCEILEPVDKNKRKCLDMWKVRCYCGKEFEARPSDIKNGHTKSHGCLFLEKIKIVNENNKKYNYYNYINQDTQVQLLKPVDLEKDKGYNEWYALCPRHDPPIQFIAAAYDVINGKIKSCKCLSNENRIKDIRKFNEQRRIENGLKSTDYLMQKTEMIRQMIYYPIKDFVKKIDKNKCVRCGGQNNLIVHHIYPFFSINLDCEEDLRKMFDLNHVITLCDNDEGNDCHYIAHNRDWYDLDLNIQQELLVLTSQRVLTEEQLKEYTNIVKTKIESQLIHYLNNQLVLH